MKTTLPPFSRGRSMSLLVVLDFRIYYVDGDVEDAAESKRNLIECVVRGSCESLVALESFSEPH